VPESNRDVLLDPHRRFADLPATRLASLLEDGPAVLESVLAGPPEERADGGLVIANLGTVTAEALRRHDEPLFDAGLSAFSDCWKLGQPEAMYPLRTPDFEASLWESIVLQLYALGAVAVEEERWAAIRPLTQQIPSGSLRESRLRHGQVASSRAADYPENTILSLASRIAARLGVHRPQEMVARFDLLSGLRDL
jgi:hypothetical protein